MPDGPQWVLDQWGNAANNTEGKNVFHFVRIEDIGLRQRPGSDTSSTSPTRAADSGTQAR